MEEPEAETSKSHRIFEASHNLLLGVLIALCIGFLNFLLIRYWFIGDYNQSISSIEISYIQMAKFWSEGGSGWQPQWYLGHPWNVFYTPLLPTLELIAHNLLNFSFPHAYRVITGAAYVLVPVSLFFFVWQVSKSKTGAIVAALFYSFLPSVMAFIAQGIADDNVSGGLEPRRFAILVRWGEGPHTLSLIFIPLYGLFLSRYFGKKRFRDLLITCIILALCALTNAIVVWVALLLTFSMVLSELIQGENEFIGLLKKLLSVCALTFGLIAFWYNWQFITTFFKEGGGAISNWLALFPWGFLVLSAVFAASFVLLKKVSRKFIGLPFALYWFVMLFAVVYVYYASGESRLEYAPQALRLNTEVDLALGALVGVIVSRAFIFVSGLGRGILKVGTTVVASIIFIIPSSLILIFGMDLLRRLPNHTRSISESPIGAVENTGEYRAAKKLGELTTGTNQRVFAPGNYGFWLNYFEPVPQLRGALFQSSTNSWPDHFYYQVANGSDSQISLALLKIANIGKLIFTTGGSAEEYKDYKVSEEKFSTVLTKVFEDRGDIYYSVPLKNDSMAKVVDVSEIKSIKKAKNAIDSEPIFSYVSAIEKNADKRLSFIRVSDSRYKISGDVGQGEGVLVQQTYDSGWKVKALRSDSGQGGSWSKFRDAFDFLVLVPKNSGKFEIELVYSKPGSVYVGYLITIFTIGFIVKRLFNPIYFKKKVPDSQAMGGP